MIAVAVLPHRGHHVRSGQLRDRLAALVTRLRALLVPRRPDPAPASPASGAEPLEEPRDWEDGGYQPGDVPPPDPDSPETRLLRAIFGLCPECERTDPHYHDGYRYGDGEHGYADEVGDVPPPASGLVYAPAMSHGRPSVRVSRRPAPTLTDMTVTVHRPEFAACPQAVITGGRWWQ
jgi:hypothetical protein